MKNLYSEFMDRVSELQEKISKRYSDSWRTYFADIEKFSADARSQAGELWRTYLSEVQTAGAGDDAMQAAGAAGVKFSQAYSELEDQYVTACRERMRALSENLTSLDFEYNQQSIDSMIGYLESLRAQIGSDGAMPSSQKSSSGSESAKQATSKSSKSSS